MAMVCKHSIKHVVSMTLHVKLTQELRKKVLSLKASGLSFSAVPREVKRPQSVISCTLKIYKKKEIYFFLSSLVHHANEMI